MMTGVRLAIETSQRTGSVAIALGEGREDHEMLRATERHEDDLMPAIDRLFQRNRLSQRDLEAVGVSIGPGGFTGLRIAVSTAKMLAESLGAKIAAVPSALVAAEFIQDQSPILVCLASKRDSTWATRVERSRGECWHIAGTPRLVSTETVPLHEVAFVIADEFLPSTMRDRIVSAGFVIKEPLFDARACLAITQRMIDAGDTTDSLLLQPIYGREPEAVRLWEKKASKHSGR